MIRLTVSGGIPESRRVDFKKDQLTLSYAFPKSTLIAMKPFLALDLVIEWIASRARIALSVVPHPWMKLPWNDPIKSFRKG